MANAANHPGRLSGLSAGKNGSAGHDDLGVEISKRQIVRLLTSKQDAFVRENIEVLRAGLASASWLLCEAHDRRYAVKAFQRDQRGKSRSEEQFAA